MSDSPVICIITAIGCGHCEAMRKPNIDSNPPVKNIPGGYSWGQDFFKMLAFGQGSVADIQGPQHFRVFEINFQSRNPDYDTINEVNQFTWNGNKMIQTTTNDSSKIQQLIPRGIIKSIKKLKI